LSLLVIDDIAIGGVNAEIFNLIAQRLKRESPMARTMMVTLTIGRANSGYIPNDAAFGYQTFEVLSSRLQPGCAETAIVDGLLDLMESAKQQ
jgi:neutral ceramidase